jgi:hypothetical protein
VTAGAAKTIDRAVREGEIDLESRMMGLVGRETQLLEQILRHPMMSLVLEETRLPAGSEAALSAVADD